MIQWTIWYTYFHFFSQWYIKLHSSAHGPLTRYVKLRIAHAPVIPGTFSPPPRGSDPDMHHGTCVTHVPWCMPGSLTSGIIFSRCREKVPGIPGACTTRNFTYLVRSPWTLIPSPWHCMPSQFHSTVLLGFKLYSLCFKASSVPRNEYNIFIRRSTAVMSTYVKMVTVWWELFPCQDNLNGRNYFLTKFSKTEICAIIAKMILLFILLILMLSVQFIPNVKALPCKLHRDFKLKKVLFTYTYTCLCKNVETVHQYGDIFHYIMPKICCLVVMRILSEL